MQYGSVPSTASLGVLFGIAALQWALVAAVLRWRYATLSPAKHLGLAPAPAAAGGSASSARLPGSKSDAGLDSHKPSSSGRSSPTRSGGSGSSPRGGYARLQAAEEGAV